MVAHRGLSGLERENSIKAFIAAVNRSYYATECDIHLTKDFRGKRYVERITECIPVEDKNEYTYDHRKEKTLEGKLDFKPIR